MFLLFAALCKQQLPQLYNKRDAMQAANATFFVRCMAGIGRRAVVALAIVWLAIASHTAVCAAPVDIARGVSWLQGQVQPSGQFLTASGVATVAQAQCETAQTLLRLAGNNTQVAALVGAMPSSGADVPTETLACWQSMRQQQGLVAVAPLSARRIAQGGYAAFDFIQVANVLDTSWALGALGGQMAEADKQSLLVWLQAHQNADGALEVSGVSNLYVTAQVLRWLKEEAPRATIALQLAQQSAAYVLGQKTAGSGWASDIALTALAYEAVHPYTGKDATIASTIEAYLLSQQQTNGAWAEDPYVTALALRALALVGVTPQPPGQPASTGIVQGQASDGSSGLPLANAAVTVMFADSGSSQVAVTGADGHYVLAGVQAGSVTLSATKDVDADRKSSHFLR
ncbi:MAG TPA: carboxypeptidase regulatory-like domain-containing protein [Burkholderiaceae bacterium]